jgi:hypothetical protein
MNAVNMSSTQWSLAGEDMEVSCDNPAHNGGRMIFACCRGAFASSAKLAEWEQERLRLVTAAPTRPKCAPCKGDPTGSGFCRETQCEEKCQTAVPSVYTDAAPKSSAGCLVDISGGWLYLSRESWGVVCDALISQVAVLESRKKVNPESTADLGVIEATNILRALEPLSYPISLAAARSQQSVSTRIED